ncbi:MAG: HEAT repeat domain-containing protein [Planctomycetota bacterium]
MRRGLSILLLIGASSLAAAQGPGRPSDEELDSPYERVRAAAVLRLASDLAADPPADPDAVSRLDDARVRIRVGVVQALARAGHLSNPAWRTLVRTRLGTESDEGARDEMLGAVARAGLVTGVSFAEVAGEAARSPSARRAVTRAVRDALERELHAGTRWTQYRRLARLAALEPQASRVLAGIVRDTGAGLETRCLAVMTLARLDAPEFWGGEAPPDPDPVALILDARGDDAPASLKMALLFGLAMRGPDGLARSRRVATFALEDAFGGQLIESALYYLYTLPAPAAREARDEIARCVDEYGDDGYSDRELYGASQLRRRLEDPARLRRAVTALPERPESFALYFEFCAVLDGLKRLPAEEAAAIRARLVAWGLDEARTVPQVRLGAWWYAREEAPELPRPALEPLLAAVRDSALAVHGEQADSDFYAQRGAAELLGAFPDPANAPVLRRLLDHDSEAVRMAACLAASRAPDASFTTRLVEIAGEDGDYAGVGAALALAALEDPRAAGFLVDVLDSGNRLLMPDALARLRALRGESIAAGLPDTPSAWRARARAWRERLRAGDQPSR